VRIYIYLILILYDLYFFLTLTYYDLFMFKFSEGKLSGEKQKLKKP